MDDGVKSSLSILCACNTSSLDHPQTLMNVPQTFTTAMPVLRVKTQSVHTPVNVKLVLQETVPIARVSGYK